MNCDACDDSDVDMVGGGGGSRKNSGGVGAHGGCGNLVTVIVIVV